jgi:hypothetical protein
MRARLIEPRRDGGRRGGCLGMLAFLGFRLQLMSSPTPPPRSASPENLRPSNNNALAAYSARQRETSTPTTKPVETVVIPPGGFSNHEKAEEAFIYLLKRDGVDETWTWDQTMRKIIMDPLYKALETLAQKKAAFEKVSPVLCATFKTDL